MRVRVCCTSSRGLLACLGSSRPCAALRCTAVARRNALNSKMNDKRLNVLRGAAVTTGHGHASRTVRNSCVQASRCNGRHDKTTRSVVPCRAVSRQASQGYAQRASDDDNVSAVRPSGSHPSDQDVTLDTKCRLRWPGRGPLRKENDT